MPRDSCKCGTCGKRIYYSDGYVKRNGLQAARIVAVRRHYRKKHPGKFKKFIAKGVATRKRRRRLKRDFLDLF